MIPITPDGAREREILLATLGICWLFVDVYLYTSSILAIIFQLEDVFCRKSWGYETDTFGEEPLFLWWNVWSIALVVFWLGVCQRVGTAIIYAINHLLTIYINVDLFRTTWMDSAIGISENASLMASRMRAAAAVARMRQKGWEEEHGGMLGDGIGCCFRHLLPLVERILPSHTASLERNGVRSGPDELVTS